MIILTSLGILEYGKYWRFISLFLCAGLEYTMLFTSYNPFSMIFWRPQFQIIAILHQLFLVYSIALSQVGPLIYPNPNENISQLVRELHISVESILSESSLLFKQSLEPFKSNAVLAGVLESKMQQLAIQLRFRGDPAYASVYNAVEAKKRN